MQYSETTPRETDPRRPWAVLVAIVLLVALPVRLYVAASAVMMSPDGAAFIWYAQRLADRPVEVMRAEDQHPLYPAMILAAHGGIQAMRAAFPSWLADPVLRWQFAAVAVALVGGLLVVVAVYALACRMFDRRVTLIAAAMAALTAQFCQLSADGLTDMPHLAVYLFGLVALLRGLQRDSLPWLTAGGALSGIAFLLRPEGGEVAVVGVLATLLLVRRWPLRRRVGAVLCVGLAAALVASPYMMATGKLVKKKSLLRFIGGGSQAAMTYNNAALLCRADDHHSPIHSAAVGLPIRAVGRILENWARALRVTLLLPAVLWLGLRRRRPCEPVAGRVIAGAVWLHLAVLLLLILQFDYLKLFSVRHAMILAGLTLPFSAAGVAFVLDAVPPSRRRSALAGLAVVLIAPTLPWMLAPVQQEAITTRLAGEWIRANSGSNQRIMTTRARAAYYADGEWVWSPEGTDAPWILAEARDRKPGWLVFEEQRMLRESPEFFEQLKAALWPGESIEWVHTAAHPKAKDRVRVYRWRPAVETPATGPL